MKLERRTFLVGASSAAIAGSLSGIFAADVAPRGGGHVSRDATQLRELLEIIFAEQMRELPQSMTSLGLDRGEGAWARAKLDGQSVASLARITELRRQWLARLKNIDRANLTGMDANNYDTVHYHLDLSLQGSKAFSFGRPGFPLPYVLSQMTGTYQSVPDFLDSQHVLETGADAEAYLSRLQAFAQAMNDESDRAQADREAGVIPPDFVIDKTLQQMSTLRGVPVQESTLVASVVRRAAAKGIAGDWRRRASEIVSGPVWSALDRQIALLREWRRSAKPDAGIWALPDGAAYYRFATHYQTTTTMTAEEIHRLGLDLVAQLSSAADAMLRQNGLTQGSIGERMTALYKDPRFIFPNTDTGKAQLLAYLNDRVRAIVEKLPSTFGTLPRAGLEIKRVPVAIEAGSPGGYYQDGTLDGSRPGAYYINLRDTAEVPRWTLPTLTFHEGIPGHHLQGAIALEATDLPMLRRILWFTAYGEGWALYAEQLADEMGLYESDPWGRIGYLHDAIFRAVRLVADTGLHHKRWSREKAIQYYMQQMGDPRPVAATEIDRYCVMPGQACSYMIGKIKWLALRSAAKARLGARFDIRKFHDRGLLAGPMPLEVLEKWMSDWMTEPGV
jgi:uncharacterized protein (DUF885 family)